MMADAKVDSGKGAPRGTADRFDLMADTAPVLIWKSGIDSLCEYFNRPWLEFTGRTLDEELGTGWTRGVHPDDMASCMATYRSAFEARVPFDMEYRLRRADGQYRWVYDKGVPLHGPSGEFEGYVGSLIDITDRIEAENEIRHKNAEVQEAYARLLEVDRLKTAFLSTVSHELRTPLSAIKGFAELLEDGMGGPLTPTGQEYLAQIQTGTQRLERLVNDILEYSHLEYESLTLRLAVDDLGEVIRKVVSALDPLARTGGLALSWDLPAEPVLVPMDARRIEQVLMNLVGNALKFTPRGGRICVTVTHGDDWAMVAVTDSGIGISADDLTRVFSRFFQVDSSLTRPYGGVGLGLAISKEIVEAHAGQIGVLSEFGKGSTFWFKIPALSSPNDAN